jgi:hypothetical protein
MKPRILKGPALAALSCALMATASQAQPQQEQKPPSSEESASRTIHRRAVEAVIWGMPVQNSMVRALDF